MSEPKIKPSDLDREAQRLIDSGQMPTLEQLLSAVAQVREKYRDQILPGTVGTSSEAQEGVIDRRIPAR
jgi:hypothetical protein